MTISTLATSLKNRLNAASPNDLADIFRSLAIGSILRALTTTYRKYTFDGITNASNLATLNVITLPDDAKAAYILRATARATNASGTLGELTVEPYGTTPADQQIAVTPNGDIAVLAASKYTGVDVVYVPEQYDTIEVTLPVTANVLTLPASVTTPGAILLMEAVGVGTSGGSKVVLVPSGSAPSAGQARLNVAKTTVTFASADAITSATVKLAVGSAIDVNTALEAAATFG